MSEDSYNQKINEGSFGQGQAHGSGSAHLEATLLLGSLGGLVDEGLVDVGDDTTARNRRLWRGKKRATG